MFMRIFHGIRVHETQNRRGVAFNLYIQHLAIPVLAMNS